MNDPNARWTKPLEHIQHDAEDTERTWEELSLVPFVRPREDVMAYWDGVLRSLDATYTSADWLYQMCCVQGAAWRLDFTDREGPMHNEDPYDYARCDRTLLYRRSDHDRVFYGEFWVGQYKMMRKRLERPTRWQAEASEYVRIMVKARTSWQFQFFQACVVHEFEPGIAVARNAQKKNIYPDFSDFYNDWYSERPFWAEGQK